MAIKLLNIYTHQYGVTPVEKSCTVYNNGIMRLAVWAEVQYQDVSESDVISDVQKNLTIYHGQAGDMSAWTPQQGNAGEYDHDVASLEQKEILPSDNDSKAYSTTRVPVYFTVPTSATTTSVLASYGGVSISQAEAITVNVIHFEPAGFKLEIEDAGSQYDCATLRKLYISSPMNHRLTHWEPLGLSFGHTYSAVNSYIPIMSMIHSGKGHKSGVFLVPGLKEPGNFSIHPVASAPYRYYEWGGKGSVRQVAEMTDARFHTEYAGEFHAYGDTNSPAGNGDRVYTTESACWMDSEKLDINVVNKIYSEGSIAMIKVSKKKLEMLYNSYPSATDNHFLDFEDPVHSLTDNFGNKIKITINWDDGDWWGDWAVTKVEKA